MYRCLIYAASISKCLFASFLYQETHWNPWIANISQVHPEPSTDHRMPLMEMYQEEPYAQNLPDNIKLVETLLPTGRHRGVFCGQRRIAKGTRYGPYTGNIIIPQEVRTQDNNSVWEVSYDKQFFHERALDMR